jgi:hypothetical protein
LATDLKDVAVLKADALVAIASEYSESADIEFAIFFEDAASEASIATDSLAALRDCTSKSDCSIDEDSYSLFTVIDVDILATLSAASLTCERRSVTSTLGRSTSPKPPFKIPFH